MNIALGDPAVQAALISALGAVIATTLAAVSAAFIGKKFTDRKLLQQKLELCTRDVEYLLKVEAAHVALHKALGSSNKLKVRESVRNRGYTWSGKFTPGRVRHPEQSSQA